MRIPQPAYVQNILPNASHVNFITSNGTDPYRNQFSSFCPSLSFKTTPACFSAVFHVPKCLRAALMIAEYSSASSLFVGGFFLRVSSWIAEITRFLSHLNPERVVGISGMTPAATKALRQLRKACLAAWALDRSSKQASHHFIDSPILCLCCIASMIFCLSR